MTTSSSCINDVLPSEILQNIFLLSADSFNDALRISATCRLWRKLIFNPFMIERYWKFNDKHRKKDLVRWWNLNGNVSDQNNSSVIVPTTDCFPDKCASLISAKENTQVNDFADSQYNVDRGHDYIVALWLLISETDNEIRCLFYVTDNDWDYSRSTGVAISEDNFLSIVFQSSISHRIIPSDVKIKPNEWFHIILVQERKLDTRTPEQTLWINGQRTITLEVPIAAYDCEPTVSFCLWSEWNRSIADVSLWSRCLSPIEIRAIYEQKTAIDKVDITKYIFQHLNK